MQPIKELSHEAVHVVPSVFDWSGDKWSSFVAYGCETCGVLIPLNEKHGNEKHSSVDDSTCDGHIPWFDGPSMNYWYPIIGYKLSVQDMGRISHLPLCIVEVDGTWGLALTGGGMDFSWEICEAFISIGMLPPIHFADLPAIAGRGFSDMDRRIMAACKASLVAGTRALRDKMRRLASLRSRSDVSADSDE